MARPKKIKEVIEAVDVIEPVAIKLRTIKLQGTRGSSLTISINGTPTALPCGVDLEISEELYTIVEPYIV